MATVTVALAIYAAAVASAALAWNVVSWMLGNMTRVRVLIEPTKLIMGEGPLDNLTVIARNLSAHPIQAISASFEIIDAPARQFHLVPTPHPSQSIPGVIPARSMALRWMPRDDAEHGGLVNVPIRAYVVTAHREKPYYSKIVTVSPDAWEAEVEPGPPRYRIGPPS